MNRAFLAVERFFFARTSPYPVAACRIGLGAIFFLCYLLYRPHMEVLFGEQGMHSYANSAYWSPLGALSASAVSSILMLAALCFCVGFMSRTSGVVLFVCHWHFARIGFTHTWGWWTIIGCFLVWLIVAHPGTRASVDALIQERRGKPARTDISMWPVRMIQLHVICVYIAAAYPRLFYEGWFEGGMIFEVLTNASYARLTLVDWYWATPILTVLNYAVWLVELLAPLLLWVPRFRTLIACTLMALHLGLEISATLGWWQNLMVVMLIIFLPIPWVEQAFGWRPTRPRTA